MIKKQADAAPVLKSLQFILEAFPFLHLLFRRQKHTDCSRVTLQFSPGCSPPGSELMGYFQVPCFSAKIFKETRFSSLELSGLNSEDSLLWVNPCLIQDHNNHSHVWKFISACEGTSQSFVFLQKKKQAQSFIQAVLGTSGIVWFFSPVFVHNWKKWQSKNARISLISLNLCKYTHCDICLLKTILSVKQSLSKQGLNHFAWKCKIPYRHLWNSFAQF